MPLKFRDNISNGSGVIVLTDRQTYRIHKQTLRKQYHPRCARGGITRLQHCDTGSILSRGLNRSLQRWLVIVTNMMYVKHDVYNTIQQSYAGLRHSLQRWIVVMLGVGGCDVITTRQVALK